jgi:predicted RNA binding protein YcfA (HicA-like mRNA interferase family)
MRLLRRYGYERVRQVGSHIRARSNFCGNPQHITIPDHSELRLGTLYAILSDVAGYLGMERTELADQLFKK